jgi:ribosomal protein L3
VRRWGADTGPRRRRGGEAARRRGTLGRAWPGAASGCSSPARRPSTGLRAAALRPRRGGT